MEAIYEFHYQVREYGRRHVQLYERCPNGQLALVDAYEAAPFDGWSDLAAWLTKRLWETHKPLSV